MMPTSCSNARCGTSSRSASGIRVRCSFRAACAWRAARARSADGVKIALATARGPLDAVGWGMAARAGGLVTGAQVDIAYRLDVNEYQGTRTLQAVLQDFRPVG